MDAAEEDDEEAWWFEDVAVIRLYSLPDEVLLKDSSHMFVTSELSGEFVVACIKSIKSIIGMIPHCLKHPSGTTEDCFFLLEKPGLNVSQLGISYNMYQDEDDQDVDIEQQ